MKVNEMHPQPVFLEDRLQQYLFQVRDRPQIYVKDVGSLGEDSYLLGEDERKLAVIVTLKGVYKPRFSRFESKNDYVEIDFLSHQDVMETIPLAKPNTLEFLEIKDRVRIPVGRRSPESIFFDGIVPVKKGDAIVVH